MSNNNDFSSLYSDNGCQAAADFLGHQSKCIYCPFSKCIDSLTQKERKALKEFWHTGRLQPEYIYLANLAIYIVNHNQNRDRVKV